MIELLLPPFVAGMIILLSLPVNPVISFKLKLFLPEGVTNNSQSVFKVRWTIPTVANGKVIDNNNVLTSLHYAWNDNGFIGIYYHNNRPWEKINGTWRLEVRTLEDKVIFDKTFTTKVQ